ncbi:MAG TPA: hypothetical protein VMR66_05820 [Gemmatimonadota bacterium]|nr:hypothetical protein [Gemmatimonadota bacterium]
MPVSASRLLSVFALAGAWLATAVPAAAQDAEPAVARVEIQPARVEATVGDTVQLTATAYGEDGEVLSVPASWFTSYEVGAIDSAGRFVATNSGERTIGAMAGRETATIPVVVAALPPSRVEIGLPATTVAATSWLPLEATAYDRLDRIAFDADVTWQSSDPSVAEAMGPWLVTKKPGTVTLTATVEGDASATQAVTVTAAPGGPPALRAPRSVVRTGDVVRLWAPPDGRASVYPRWTVLGPRARVDPDGAFVAEEPGQYVVTADIGGQTASVALRVEPRTFDRELQFVGRGAVSYAHTGDLWVFENAAYVGNFGDNSLRVFDVSDPANPVMTDSIVVDARRVNDVKVNVEGGFAIMTREGASDRRNGILVLDIADPLHPTVFSEYTETVTGGVHNTFIVGDLVYAVNNGTRDMHIIDVTDRRNPREVGRWGLPNPNKVLHDVFVKDGIAYLSYWDDGLVILDLGGAGKGGTPAEPVFVSRVYYPGGNTHVAWRWRDYVFVGDEIFPPDWDPDKPIRPTGYIRVFDVSDLENPVEVAKYEVPEAGTHNVWIEDDETTLYIGYYNAGLRAVDVSGEMRGDLYRQGREIDHYITATDENVKVPNAPMNWGAMIHEGKIYSADFNSGLWIHQWVPTGDRPIS